MWLVYMSDGPVTDKSSPRANPIEDRGCTDQWSGSDFIMPQGRGTDHTHQCVQGIREIANARSRHGHGQLPREYEYVQDIISLDHLRRSTGC